MSNESNSAYNRSLVDLSLLVLRLSVGVIMAVHGWLKLSAMFGEPGAAVVIENLGVGPLGYLVVIGEFLGGLGLIFGFLTRFSATSNIVIMIGAIAMVHGKKGFFLSDGGFEYNLALIGLLVPIFLLGPGAFTVGRFLPLPKSAKTGRTVVVLE